MKIILLTMPGALSRSMTGRSETPEPPWNAECLPRPTRDRGPDRMRSIAAAFVAAMTMTQATAYAQSEPGVGPNPQLPEPQHSLFPTVNIAPASSWANGEKPTPGVGFEVNEYAGGLDHPRWLYTLPDGDVLVAETNAPPKPEDGK